MKAGETERWMCDDCNAEFEITFEPKAKGDKKSAAQIDPQIPTTCPFCGAESIEAC